MPPSKRIPRTRLTFDKERFGRNFKRFRLRMGFSTRDVEYRTFVQANMVSKIERGNNAMAESVVCLAFFANLKLENYVLEDHDLLTQPALFRGVRTRQVG